MPSNTWNNRVEHVEDGQRVDAAQTGRATRQLEGRTNYLKDRLDAADAGEALVAHNVTLHEDCLVGTPVYWREATQQFEPAIAAVEVDAASGLLVPTATSDVVGVVMAKVNATLGHLCIAGRVEIDLSLVISGEATGGRYYLSGQDAGKLVKQRPPVSVAVLHYANGFAVIAPAMRDFLEDHIHYQQDLVCRQASAVGDQGWLAADDASFQDTAPPGAIYGYNLAAHPALDRVFPPIPVSGAAVFWDKGDGNGGALAPPSLVIVDNNGIWWMSDCEGMQPFQPLGSSSSSSSSESVSACPFPERMRVTLMFVHMVYATDRSVVTSLTAREGSPLSFTNCDNVPASTGALIADIDLDFVVDDELVDGNLVVKELDGLSFKRGRVIEGLKAGNGILLSGGTVMTSGHRQGLVTVDLDSDPAERELAPQIVRLIDAKEEYYKDIPFIGLRSPDESSIRVRFRVPLGGMPANPRFHLRAWLLGTVTGTFPDLALTSRRMPRPSSPLLLPQPVSEATVVFAPSRSITADHYFEIDSDDFAVDAGDTVLLTLTRQADDGYSGNVGILQMFGVITAG